MAEPRKAGEWRWLPTSEHVAGGLLKGNEQIFDIADKTVFKAAPKVTRIVAKRIPGVPGPVYDAATLATADDKGRKIAGIVGGALGGAAGGVAGSAAGPIGSVAGAVGGSAFGENLAEQLYDHRLEIADWMKVRAATAGHDLAEGLEHYAPVNRIRRSYGRR